ncbi:MAG: GNAT family N-acetyltransferase [Candidatus Lokiarchaeota archaeon]|nr:GNAT family N-acetyltransferase [Candidatus Harpocratesius repetitus]
MKREIQFNGSPLIFREYDFENDPPKLVKYLYDKMNSPDGIAALKKGDLWLKDKSQVRVRLVAEYEQELIASLVLEGCLGPKPNDRFTLFSVVTAPQYRGKGISKLLFEFAKEWIRRYNARILLVETWENNLSARKFYEKMGFKQYGCLPKGSINRQGEGYVDEILYYMNL